MKKPLSKKWKIIIIIAIIVTIIVASIFIIINICDHIETEKRHQANQELYNTLYQERLDRYESENNEYDDYEIEVAFLGDSLTDGCDVNYWYGDTFTVLNRGIGGDTTFTLYDRLKVSVYDLKPQVIVLLIGGNNLDTMFDNYEDILKGFKENLPETKILLVSLSAMSGEWAENSRNEKAIVNNQKIKSLSIEYDYEFVDIFTPLYDLDTGEAYSDVTVDGAHFTTKGYEIVTTIIKNKLSEMIQK